MKSTQKTSSILWLVLSILVIAIVTFFGPREKTLGTNIRVVYLHGAWVWAALAALIASGMVGLLGIISKDETIQRWSQALGRSGLTFWITYLPISIWAMQTNWNGLFLVEPRWRIAVIFAISGLLIQIGVSLMRNLKITAWVNAAFITTLMIVLSTTDQVMHPDSPVFTSESWQIRIFFGGLALLMMFTAWQLSRFWYAIASGGTGKYQ